MKNRNRVLSVREVDGEYLLDLRRWINHANEYAAKIEGIEDVNTSVRKARFKLKFCSTVERDWSRSGGRGTTTVELQGEGYYFISNPDTGLYKYDAMGYYYWDGKSEEMHEVDKKEVVKYFKEQKQEQKQEHAKEYELEF